MPKAIYRNHGRYSEPQLVGVCNNKDLKAVLAKLNEGYLKDGDNPEMVEFKKQRENIKKKIENLKSEIIKIDRSKVDSTEQQNLTKLLNLANLEVNKKLSEAGNNLKEVENKIKLCTNDMKYFAQDIRKLNA